MTHRLIEVHFAADNAATVAAVADQAGVLDFTMWPATQTEGRLMARIVTRIGGTQRVTDALQLALGQSGDWQLSILPVEATIPTAIADDPVAQSSREEIYQDVAGDADTSTNFLVLTTLSVVIATIGLNADNATAVIGAMVIAPLLGPNLALALGAALGDAALMRRASVTNGIGLISTLLLGAGLGAVLTPDLSSGELMARTVVALPDIAIALASGAAAALTMTTGLGSALVGVMVAVALMPPAVTAGFLVWTAPDLTLGALLLFLTNVTCVNLAAQAVLVWKGVTPRRWREKQDANRSRRINLAIWGVILALLAVSMIASTAGVCGDRSGNLKVEASTHMRPCFRAQPGVGRAPRNVRINRNRRVDVAGGGYRNPEVA